jgi:hypothetical protein
MKARVFLDAFVECVAGVAHARRHPGGHALIRAHVVNEVCARHGLVHAIRTAAMFDRLWGDLHGPGVPQ